MSECQAGGVGISCPGGCGVVCTRQRKKMKCVAVCNPEVAIFKLGGKFSLKDDVLFCAHNLRAESVVVLFQHALPSHRVRDAALKMNGIMRHTGRLGEIAQVLGLTVERAAATQKGRLRKVLTDRMPRGKRKTASQER